MAKQLVLQPKLDTSNAGQLRDELIAADGQDLIMNAAQVEHVGALCAELLMSARHLWGQSQKSIRIEDPSHQMHENLGRMGLSLDDLVTGDTP